MTEALLALEDGTVYRGEPFGARGTTFGEAVFNTALTGYQEVLTDPSYHGQIVAMTYPHQGNYGVNDLDAEAAKPWVRGFVVRDATPRPSSWRSQETLFDYLSRHGIVGIRGIDTRALTRRLRTAGAMAGGISTELDAGSLVEAVRSAPALVGTDLVRDVTPAAAWDPDVDELLATGGLTRTAPIERPATGARIAAIDYGMKRNILRRLVGRGFVVRVFPASAPADEILSWGPDGAFLSNGPGDPAAVPYAVETIRGLLGARLPTFGICLGHQLLGAALGGSLYKLKFGHRGANHPVKSLVTGHVEITAQNHGFAVSTGVDLGKDGDAWRVLAQSTAGDWMWQSGFGAVALTHFDLNDGTLEGVECRDVPAYSVQYHPEAAPGPHDARYLFDDFEALISNPKGDRRGVHVRR